MASRLIRNQLPARVVGSSPMSSAQVDFREKPRFLDRGFFLRPTFGGGGNERDLPQDGSEFFRIFGLEAGH